MGIHAHQQLSPNPSIHCTPDDPPPRDSTTSSRRLPFTEIAHLEGIDACRRTLVKAFEKEAYFRRVAAEKPHLTEKQRQDRLKWAKLHKDWTDWQWSRVIWTDECSIACGGFRQVYVTRDA
ncbi:hypothetical protein BU23DRAFT_516642, partial [Bimuria novae-zelandiae CBS 107.79]